MKKTLLFLAVLALAGPFWPTPAHALVQGKYKGVVSPYMGSPNNRLDLVVELASASVGELIDVSTTGATNGNCFVYNAGSGIWEPGSCGSGGGGGSSSLGVFKNKVEITSPTAQINFTGTGFGVTAIGSTATVSNTITSSTNTWTAPQTFNSTSTLRVVYIDSMTSYGTITSSTGFVGGDSTMTTINANSIILRTFPGQTLCNIDVFNASNQLAWQTQVTGETDFYGTVTFPSVGSFYNASVGAGKFYRTVDATGQLYGYDLFNGTQTWSQAQTFLSSTTLSSSTVQLGVQVYHFPSSACADNSAFYHETGGNIICGGRSSGGGSGSSFFDGNSFAGGKATGPVEMQNFAINNSSDITVGQGGITVGLSTAIGMKALFNIQGSSYLPTHFMPLFDISTNPSHGGTVFEVNRSSIVSRAQLFLPVQAANSAPALSFIGNPTLGLYFTGANFAFKGTAIDIFTIGAAGAATLAAGQMNISNGGTAAAPGVNLGGTQTGIFKPDGSTMSVVVAGSLATVKAKFADDGITIGNASSPFNTATLTISTNCSGNACQPIVVISSHNWGNPWRVAEITKDSMTVNVPMFQSSLTVTGSATFGLTISTPSKFPSGIDVGTVLLSSGDPIGFSTTVYANGTAYSLTATMATLDFGTKDPIVTLEKAGTYFVYAQATLRYNGATYAANQTATVKVVRTNNTPADIDNASQFATLRIITTITDTVGILPIAPIIYTTASGGDTLAIQGSVSATPAAGSVDVTSATIVCIRLR